MGQTEEQKRLARIKYELAVRAYSQCDVARECGVLPTTVGAVIHGRSRSRKIELRIAAITHLPLAELWPSWHGVEATRRQRRQSNAQSGLAAQRTAAG